MTFSLLLLFLFLMKQESGESIMDGHGGSYHYCGSGKKQVKKGRNATLLTSVILIGLNFIELFR